MARKRRNIKQEEARRYSYPPDGLVSIAASNPDYGKKFAEIFRLQQQWVKNHGRS
ncbi:hypothetical protein [Serratia symbiotica]|uniref:Uncharacterized protein n=2 Tax=Serratia symbiotica TaxID=138074 RepID=A0A7D5STA0_9GAMM|nr:hypothetical protein [Serratia symbiotica]MBQ0955958.1 hypothetical protein [Serratia symbiotica]QLH63200.1 hypothetical protein SYMBAF_09995 [Serratia symbiotica]CDG48065.1 hypothetical protein SCTVLC_1365 [Serratia symbiotica SCt-VLC]